MKPTWNSLKGLDEGDLGHLCPESPCEEPVGSWRAEGLRASESFRGSGDSGFGMISLQDLGCRVEGLGMFRVEKLSFALGSESNGFWSCDAGGWAFGSNKGCPLNPKP